MYGNCALAVFNSSDCIKIGRKLFTIIAPTARIKKVIKVQDGDSFLDNYGKFVSLSNLRYRIKGLHFSKVEIKTPKKQSNIST